MHLFGKKPAPAPVDTLAAVTQMKESVDKMQARADHLQKKADREGAIAREAAQRGDKRAALAALKRKKMLTTEVDNVLAYQGQMEGQIMAVQGSEAQREAVETLKLGLEAQKRQQLNINELDKLVDDLEDMKDQQREVRDLLVGSQEEDPELLEELEALEAEQFKVPATVPVPVAAPVVPVPAAPAPLPPAPAAVPADGVTDHEAREMAELSAMLG